MGFNESFDRGLPLGVDVYFRSRADRRDQDIHDEYTRPRNQIILDEARQARNRSQRAYEMDMERLRELTGGAAGPYDEDTGGAYGLTPPRAAVMPAAVPAATPPVARQPAPTGPSPVVPPGTLAPAASAPAVGLPPPQGAPVAPPQGRGAPPVAGVGLASAADPYQRFLQEADFARRRALASGDVKGYDEASAKRAALELESLYNSGLLQARKMTQDELLEQTRRVTENKGIPFNVVPVTPPKSGGKDITHYMAWLEGYKPIVVTRPQLEQLFAADQLAERGYGTEAMRRVSDILAKLKADRDDAVKKTVDAASTMSNADSAAGLRGAQAASISYSTELQRQQEKRRDEAAKVVEEYSSLSPEEQAGARGRALLAKFNALNVRNGGVVPYPQGDKAGGGAGGAGGRVSARAGDEPFVLYDAATGQILDNVLPGGLSVPLGVTKQELNDLRLKAARNNVDVVVVDVGGRREFRFVGADGKLYRDIETASKAISPQELKAREEAQQKARDARMRNEVELELSRGGLRPNQYFLPPNFE